MKIQRASQHAPSKYYLILVMKYPGCIHDISLIQQQWGTLSNRTEPNFSTSVVMYRTSYRIHEPSLMRKGSKLSAQHLGFLVALSALLAVATDVVADQLFPATRNTHWPLYIITILFTNHLFSSLLLLSACLPLFWPASNLKSFVTYARRCHDCWLTNPNTLSPPQSPRLSNMYRCLN